MNCQRCKLGMFQSLILYLYRRKWRKFFDFDFLISDFDNHIYVTTDAEAFFFLHDLISSYLKEKERVLNIQQQQHGK